MRGAGGVEPWGGERYLGSDDARRRRSSGSSEDDDVRAVVLRIDSPGGSALASDLILRRVELLAAEKPVVVSMSDLAASGGYYIAAKATRIVAEPGTLTGSIGVVSGKLATGRFQEELLGATHDPLQRGAHAGLYSPLVPFDDAQRALLGRRIDDVYGLFLDHVASGRKLERAARRGASPRGASGRRGRARARSGRRARRPRRGARGGARRRGARARRRRARPLPQDPRLLGVARRLARAARCRPSSPPSPHASPPPARRSSSSCRPSSPGSPARSEPHAAPRVVYSRLPAVPPRRVVAQGFPQLRKSCRYSAAPPDRE